LVAAPKIRNGGWKKVLGAPLEAQAAKVYDLYRHLKLTPYRAIIPKDAPFPSERHAQNWRKVGTIETVSPEMKKQIDQSGFCTPTLSFDEIEGANSRGPTTEDPS